MQFVSSCITDIGKHRRNNEDWILDWSEKGLYVVADGMGGERYGEVASQIAVDTIEQSIVDNYALVQTFRLTRSNEAREKIRELLVRAVADANEAVRREAEKRDALGKMGTTLTALLLVDTVGFLLHIGDSRLYLIRNATMQQISTDHTVVADYQQKYGKVPSEVSKTLVNTLTRAIGLERTVEAEITEIEVRPQDRFVLCTDGVYHVFSQDFVASLVHNLAVPGVDTFEEKRFLDHAVRTIVEEVYRNGAEDNLSVILVAVRESNEETRNEERLRDVAGIASSLPLFAHFNEAQMEQLVHASEVRSHERYEILSFPLRPEGEILIMVEGQLSVLRKSKQIDVLGPGSIIGEVAFFSERPVNYTLFVDKPATFLVIRRSTIEEFITEAPRAMAHFLWEVCRVMAEQILTTMSHVEKIEKK